MLQNIKPTLRFVALVATPLCLVNSFIFSLGAQDLFLGVWSKFTQSYLLSFPQALLYVSLIKHFDGRRKA